MKDDGDTILESMEQRSRIVDRDADRASRAASRAEVAATQALSVQYPIWIVAGSSVCLVLLRLVELVMR